MSASDVAPVKCKALFSYSAVQPDEISLAKGDVIDFIEYAEEGWWRGRLGDKVGVFPSNFVKIVNPDDVRPVQVSKPKPALSATVAGQGSLTSFGKLSSANGSVSMSDISAPRLPPKPVSEQCLVLYDYEATNEDELSIRSGEIINILSKEVPDKGWWLGTKRSDWKQTGLFPDNFVRLLSAAEELGSNGDLATKSKTSSDHESLARQQQHTSSSTSLASSSFDSAGSPTFNPVSTDEVDIMEDKALASDRPRRSSLKIDENNNSRTENSRCSLSVGNAVSNGVDSKSVAVTSNSPTMLGEADKSTKFDQRPTKIDSLTDLHAVAAPKVSHVTSVSRLTGVKHGNQSGDIDFNSTVLTAKSLKLHPIVPPSFSNRTRQRLSSNKLDRQQRRPPTRSHVRKQANQLPDAYDQSMSVDCTDHGGLNLRDFCLLSSPPVEHHGLGRGLRMHQTGPGATEKAVADQAAQSQFRRHMSLGPHISGPRLTKPSSSSSASHLAAPKKSDCAKVSPPPESHVPPKPSWLVELQERRKNKSQKSGSHSIPVSDADSTDSQMAERRRSVDSDLVTRLAPDKSDVAYPESMSDSERMCETKSATLTAPSQADGDSVQTDMSQLDILISKMDKIEHSIREMDERHSAAISKLTARLDKLGCP